MCVGKVSSVKSDVEQKWLIYLQDVTMRFVPGTKRLSHDDDHSPLSSDRVKNEWS